MTSLSPLYSYGWFLVSIEMSYEMNFIINLLLQFPKEDFLGRSMCQLFQFDDRIVQAELEQRVRTRGRDGLSRVK